MAARTIVITGASDGIGAAAARSLSSNGHTVVVVGRSREKTERVAAALDAPFLVADFAELAQVRELAAILEAQFSSIDVLANNAGGIFGGGGRTPDGFETTIQVNHLAPFLLTNLLLDRLIESRATVINTSSSAARFWGHIDPDDLNNDAHFRARRAYGDAKLANILFTRELDRRFRDRGISAVAFHPGYVATNFAANTNSLVRLAYHSPLRQMVGMITPEKGAADLVWLAETEPGVAWSTGEFYTRHHISRTNPQAGDAELARRLWELSAEMVGLGPTSSSS